MKVKQLAKLINDHGTKPRIKVIKHYAGLTFLAYEGKPDNIDKEVSELKVNSFTVLGSGFIEIHV